MREDYSPDGAAWDYLPHDRARSKAYRWGEDGLAGICDDNQKLCFALALWNGQDPILKERDFGLSGPEGNHGEDVKEYYFYLDNTPTHSYMKWLYKYPQAAFPYADLVETNGRRGTGTTRNTSCWTPASSLTAAIGMSPSNTPKRSPDDILIRITSANRGPDAATLDILPTLWFRNTWAWGWDNPKPSLRTEPNVPASPSSRRTPHELGWRSCSATAAAELLFTENETNNERLYGASHNPTPYVKDAFHEYIVDGSKAPSIPGQTGTKAAAHYHRTVDAGEERHGPTAPDQRLARLPAERSAPGFDAVFAAGSPKPMTFYNAIGSPELSDDVRNVQRQAFAGLLWSKQFYHYDVTRWLDGDPAMPAPARPAQDGAQPRLAACQRADVISMPDTWEYPWFAAWDLAFHCIPLAIIDPQFAKEQLLLLTPRVVSAPQRPAAGL